MHPPIWHMILPGVEWSERGVPGPWILAWAYFYINLPLNTVNRHFVKFNAIKTLQLLTSTTFKWFIHMKQYLLKPVFDLYIAFNSKLGNPTQSDRQCAQAFIAGAWDSTQTMNYCMSSITGQTGQAPPQSTVYTIYVSVLSILVFIDNILNQN